MITSNTFKSKKYAVVGLGRSGLATIKCLESSGAIVYAWDDSGANSDSPLTKINEMPWDSLDALVLSPGIPLTYPKPHPAVQKAQENNVPVIGDIDLLMQAQPNATYIGITGTNGKSTASTLIYHVLTESGFKVELGGNIGVPCLALSPLDKNEIYVLELSSYQLDLLNEACLDISILLNITPDHIDRHGSLENYCHAKQRIFNLGRNNSVQIVVGNDDCSQAIAKALPKVFNAPLQKKLTIEGGNIFANGEKICSFRSNFSLQGEHNAQNVIAATCVAAHFHIDHTTLENALLSFKSLPHRQEKVGSFKNIQFVNDSKATNADATSSALNRFKNIYWIVGGRAKDGGISSLKPYFKNISHAFLIGESTPAFKTELEGKLAYSECFELGIALHQAFEKIGTTGEPATILLSPCCASFDQFQNFEARGDAFKKLVSELIEQQK